MLSMTNHKTKRQLVLAKSGQKFIFRYARGDENGLIDALIDQANNKQTDFDWFDAAVLSFKLTQSLMNEADDLLCEEMPQTAQSL